MGNQEYHEKLITCIFELARFMGAGVDTTQLSRDYITTRNELKDKIDIVPYDNVVRREIDSRYYPNCFADLEKEVE